MDGKCVCPLSPPSPFPPFTPKSASGDEKLNRPLAVLLYAVIGANNHSEADMFKTLKGLGKSVEAIGFTVAAVAAVFLFVSFAAMLTKEVAMAGILTVLPAAAGVAFGIVLIAHGQTIQCFVSIEQ